MAFNSIINDPDIINRLVHILIDVFTKNDSLSCFMNSICFSQIRQKRIVQYAFCRLANIDDQNNYIDEFYSIKNNSCIKILNYAPHNLYTINFPTSTYFTFICKDRFYHDNILSSKSTYININPDCKIKGYLYGYNDFVQKYSRHDDRSIRFESYLTNIVHLYFISDKNCLLATSMRNGDLLIRDAALKKLIKNNSSQTVIKVLTDLFSHYKKIRDLYITGNILSLKDINNDINSWMPQYLCEKYLELFIKNSLNREINLTESEMEFKIMRAAELITGAYQECSRQIFGSSIINCNTDEGYYDLLAGVLKTVNNKEKNIRHEAFKRGMQIGLKLDMIGWKSANPKFSDAQDDTHVWWSKSVNIKPDIFISHKKKYKLPDSFKDSYYITDLFVNEEGIMRCYGEHPNVSGTQVCMGDLTIDFSADEDIIEDVLCRAEELLDIINWDSAYKSIPRAIHNLILNDEIEPINVLSQHIDDKQTKTQSIKNINLLYIEDDEDDEWYEELENKEIKEENEKSQNVDVKYKNIHGRIRVFNNMIDHDSNTQQTEENSIYELENILTTSNIDNDPILYYVDGNHRINSTLINNPLVDVYELNDNNLVIHGDSQ